MKKTTLSAVLLLLSFGIHAQQHDTAALVVDSYLSILNYDALPADSTLVLHTTISYHGQPDTFYMTRYYTQKGMMRVEVRNQQGDMLTGLCTNGKDRYRQYSRQLGWWEDQEPDEFEVTLQGYDFRGPLYNWRNRGIRLTYNGTSEVEGHILQVVIAEQKNHFMRYYMFDTENHLLNLVFEKDSMMEGSTLRGGIPIDWKVIHEYLPVRESLIVSEESFLRTGLYTIMKSSATLEKRNPLLFNQD